MPSADVSVCFLLRIGEVFYAESVVLDHLSETTFGLSEGELDLARPEGAVSIKHLGRELLGIEFHDMVESVFPHAEKLLAGEPDFSHLPFQSAMIRYFPRGDQLLYDLECNHPSRPWRVQRLVPLIPFLQEWTYMWLRFMKLLAHLGSSSAKMVMAGWQFTMNSQWQEILELAMVRLIVERDLPEVLASSDCSESFQFLENPPSMFKRFKRLDV